MRFDVVYIENAFFILSEYLRTNHNIIGYTKTKGHDNVMYITNTSAVQGAVGIINYMPHALRKYFYSIDLNGANEIHLSPGKPVSIYFPDGRCFISGRGILTPSPAGAVRATTTNINEALELASKSSVYSVDSDIINGFITIEGGHRIGICGSAVIREGKIAFVKDISALNYRIAKEVRGAADPVINDVLQGRNVRNTLIISPPGAGKTTMLRDIVRQISNEGIRVCVVDERREIAAVHEGRMFFDLGSSTDVFSGAPKAAGMLMMLRAMSPEVMVTDEMGGGNDIRAAERIINSGAKLITSVHGYGLEQLQKRRDLRRMLPFFETFITLSKRNGAGTIEAVTKL